MAMGPGTALTHSSPSFLHASASLRSCAAPSGHRATTAPPLPVSLAAAPTDSTTCSDKGQAGGRALDMGSAASVYNQAPNGTLCERALTMA